MLALLAAAAALLCPQTTTPIAQSRPVLRRAAVCCLSDDGGDTAWPQPAATVAELQAAATEAKEAAEAEAKASATPFSAEDGGFSPIALATFLTFVAGGVLFFQGITGGGALRFADDQPPEVQACIKQAATRDEASLCLPPVPIQ